MFRSFTCGAAGRVFTSWKKTGTKKIASTVAVSMPPITPVPMSFWLPAPAPVRDRQRRARRR